MEILVTASRRIGLQAIIQVEHDMDIVFGYSDRIIALHQGKVLADATPGRDPRRRPAWSTRSSAVPTRCPRSEGARCSRLQRSTCSSSRATSCDASRSRSATARWSAWWAATARARPPRSARSWAISARGPAASTFQGDGDPRPPHPRDRAARPRLRARGQRRSSPTSRWRRTSRSRPGRGRGGRPARERIERAYEVFPVLRG